MRDGGYGEICRGLGLGLDGLLGGSLFRDFPCFGGGGVTTFGAALTALEGFLATTLVLEEPAAFLAAVFFLDLEGRESVRAMSLSLQVAAFRETETIPKSAPCGKTEEGASDSKPKADDC